MSNEKNGRLGWGTRAAYGAGDTACNVVYGMISTLLTLFYTDYAGVPVATVGLVMLISRFFDGSSDLIMGVIINKTKSRWGKARPWILWMSIPYVITAIALFAVPQTSASLQFWYIFVTYNLCTTVCYTAINVPYGTLSTYMTRVSHERDMLSVVRMAMAPLGRIMAATLTLPVVKLFGNDQIAWVKTMAIWAVIAMILLVICFLYCKEEVKIESREQQSDVPIGRSIKALLTNRYFWAALILWSITNIHNTIVGTDLPYYCKYILGNDGWMYSAAYFTEIAMMILGALLCPVLLKKFSKRDMSLAGCVIGVVGQVAFIFGPQNFGWLMFTTVVRTLGVAPLIAVVFGMMGDVVEYGQWKTHLRQESLIFSGGAVGTKIGNGITSAVISGLLAMSHFTSSSSGGAVQPDSAKLMITGILKFGPLLIWVVAIIVLLLYRLDKMYPQIMKDLSEREARNEM